MRKFCPFGYSNTLVDCHDKCVMHNEKGCLIKQALQTYVSTHEPLKMEIPISFKHDYDEHGVDWYPHGYDDIAP